MVPDYKPGILLRNGHFNTIFSTVFSPAKKLALKRETVELSDGDFIEVEYLKNNHDKLLIVLHGLEGSSESGYMLETASYFAKRNWDICLVNHRGCSGKPNRLARSYHSGNTEDLHELILQIQERHQYSAHAVLGYSLGGNIALKFAGELSSTQKINAAIGVSVPCDLAGAAKRLSDGDNFIYNRRFLKRLNKKLVAKGEMHDDIKELIHKTRGMKELREFDEAYTAPFHGFKDAADYYSKSSCLPYLTSIQIPALLLNAKDDPFLSNSCFPNAIDNENLKIVYPEFGGHVGFYRKDYWLFPVIEAFLSKST